MLNKLYNPPLCKRFISIFAKNLRGPAHPDETEALYFRPRASMMHTSNTPNGCNGTLNPKCYTTKKPDRKIAQQKEAQRNLEEGSQLRNPEPLNIERLIALNNSFVTINRLIKAASPFTKKSRRAMKNIPPKGSYRDLARKAGGGKGGRRYSTFAPRVPEECEKRDKIAIGGNSGEGLSPGSISGMARLYSKQYNKDMCFTNKERQLLGIHGLLPPRVNTEGEQVQHAMAQLDRIKDNLDKLMFLYSLSERNERLFYKVVAADVGKMLPLVYTPTVGLACQNYSLIYQYTKGLFITLKDKGHIYDVLKNWPISDIRAIVVTDGERILGLGDLGANGMGIPIGKLGLYTALAGIKPHQCIPITLDMGTNNEKLLNDPLYIGLRQKRVKGAEFDEFLEEFMCAAVRHYGQACLIQFEDFGNANAFRLLDKYRERYCVFNDDIQGTGAVAVAGLLAAFQLTKNKMKDQKILFYGAGEAALGIAHLAVMWMTKKDGMSVKSAEKRIFLFDSKGLVVKDRPEGGITEQKAKYAHNLKPIKKLTEAVKAIKPTALIGASTIGGAFNEEILKTMAENNERPIIFALSNPTVKAECTPEQAYNATDGRCIYASGSPFPPVTYKEKTFVSGQANNSYVFPGVALGALCAGMLKIPDEVFMITAATLAEMCTKEDLKLGRIFPPLEGIRDCSVEIARSIMEFAYKAHLATLKPMPTNLCAFIRSQMFDTAYPPSLPIVYLKDKDSKKTDRRVEIDVMDSNGDVVSIAVKARKYRQ